MIPFRARTPRPDDRGSSHARARADAALRLVEPNEPDEAEWLEAHLLECAECRLVAERYATDRLLLRSLRERAPVPPRDLWARTALAIEREAGRSTALWSRGRGRGGRRSVLTLGIVSGVLVVAVVVSASLLSGGYGSLLNGNPQGPIAALASAGPGATPITVAANDVSWLQTGRNGDYDLYFAAVDEVCPATDKPACAPLDDTAGRTIKLPKAPRSVVISPTSAEMVVVSSDSQAGPGSVFVLALPAPTPTPSGPTSALATSKPGSSASAATSPSSSALTSSRPATSPAPSASASPVAGSSNPASPSPSPSAATAKPSGSVSPPGSVAPSAPASAGTAIATNVIVVGGSGAYSPDGRWFAFSARPADGSKGPDIYVWKVGAPAASIVTSDHRSVFSTWVGSAILGSRVTVGSGSDGHSPGPAGSGSIPGKSGAPSGASHAVSFLLDPATGVAVDLTGTTIWRPVVDPKGGLVVYWDGTLELDANGVSWHPASGQVVLGRWSGSDGSAGGSPTPSGRPTSSPGRSGPTALQALAEGPFSDFDARFDPTGARLALWTADPETPTVGRLTLFVIDPTTGSVDTSAAPLSGVPALRGFSIDRGRLAWVTPPGQDGQGSRVQIMGWTGDSFGSIETVPAGQLVVIH